MYKSCCTRQEFVRHIDPTVADIGQAEGAEYTVGKCCNCGSILIHCWVAGGVSEGIEVVSQELVDSFLTAPDYHLRKKRLGDWFNGLP